MAIESRRGRHFGTCWTSIFRTKSPNASMTSSMMSSEGHVRSHGFFDLVKLGTASSLALSLLVVCGQVLADISGPSIIISIFVAATAALCSGICYAELRCRWPRVVGNSYDYTYFGVGEGVAFLSAWTMLLTFISSISAVARSVSANFDALIGFRIHNLTAANLGKIIKLDSYPDFLGGFVLIIVIVIVTVGVRQPRQIAPCVNAVLVLIVTFAGVVSLFHLDFSQWSDPEEFFHDGFDGIMAGAGSLFIVYTSFDVIIGHSDFLGRSSKRCTYSVLTTFSVVTIFSLMVSGCSSLLKKEEFEYETEAALVESFELAGIYWVKYIVSSGALVILLSVLLSLLTEASDFVLRLSKDGLLFQFLTWKSKDDETAFLTSVFPGIIAVIFTVVFSLTDLIMFASIAAIFMYTLTTVVVIAIRYTPPSLLTRAAREERKRKRDERKRQQKFARTGSSGYGTTNSDSSLMTPSSPSHLPLSSQYDNNDQGEIEEALGLALNDPETAQSPAVLNSDSESDIDEVVEEYKEKLRTHALTTCSLGYKRQEIPTEQTHRRACASTVSFTFWTMCSAAILTHAAEELHSGSVPLIICELFFVVMAIVSVVILAKQPCDVIENTDVAILVPWFPWLALVTLTLDLSLLVSLDSIAWFVFFVWLISGLLLYVTYGVRHSRAANLYNFLPEEHQGLIPNSSTREQQHSTTSTTPVENEGFIDIHGSYQDYGDESDAALIE